MVSDNHPSLRLHLGCGKKRLEGYVNIDGFEPSADLVTDVRKLPYPDGSVDEILAIHLFEHFEYWETTEILKDWFRVLKPTGKLIMEMPSFDKVRVLIKHNTSQSVNLAYLGLYGAWSDRRPEMTHKWCWIPKKLGEVMAKAGFSEVKIKEPQTHVKCRDFRIEGTK